MHAQSNCCIRVLERRAFPPHNRPVIGTSAEKLALLQAENDQLNAEVAELNVQVTELQAARDRYADLYDFVSVACITLDRGGLITQANRRSVSLLRYGWHRLVGTPLMTLVVREDRRRFLAHLAICMHGVDAVTFELSLAPSEGQPIPVQLTVRCNRELGGGYAVAISDMRALESAHAEQQRLVLAQREAQLENQAQLRLITQLNKAVASLRESVVRLAGARARPLESVRHARRQRRVKARLPRAMK